MVLGELPCLFKEKWKIKMKCNINSAIRLQNKEQVEYPFRKNGTIKMHFRTAHFKIILFNLIKVK